MTSRLVTVTIDGQPRIVDLLTESQPSAGTLIEGNFQSFAANPFSAYTGMWGHYLTDNLQAESTMRVFPDTFPNRTTFTWDVTPAPGWLGINGYLHIAYGNYDWSPGSIPSRQVSAITTLTVDIDWTFQGDARSGLLCECWLSPASAPSGQFTKSREVGFLPKLSAASAAYVDGLPSVGAGSFTDSGGVTWNVREDTAGAQPYLVAYRPGHVDFTGVLHFDDYFDFLVASGKAFGNEWFNGVAFGVEPHIGAGALTVLEFTPTYA